MRKYVVFFFLRRVFGQSDKFGFFRRYFSHGAENTIKQWFRALGPQNKGDMPALELFCLSFLTVFGCPSFLPCWRFSCQTFTKNRFGEFSGNVPPSKLSSLMCLVVCTTALLRVPSSHHVIIWKTGRFCIQIKPFAGRKPKNCQFVFEEGSAGLRNNFGGYWFVFE